MTTIIIAHITKSGDNRKPFGAASWYFRPSYIWFAEKKGVQGNPKQMHCQWFNRKHRSGDEPANQSLLWTFDDPIGPITVEPTHRMASKHDRLDRACADLLREKAPLSTFEMADALDISARQVAKTMRQFPKLFVRIEDSNGKVARWALLANLPDLGLFPTNGGTAIEAPASLLSDPELAPLLQFPAHTNGVSSHPNGNDLPFDLDDFPSTDEDA